MVVHLTQPLGLLAQLTSHGVLALSLGDLRSLCVFHGFFCITCGESLGFIAECEVSDELLLIGTGVVRRIDEDLVPLGKFFSIY